MLLVAAADIAVVVAVAVAVVVAVVVVIIAVVRQGDNRVLLPGQTMVLLGRLATPSRKPAAKVVIFSKVKEMRIHNGKSDRHSRPGKCRRLLCFGLGEEGCPSFSRIWCRECLCLCLCLEMLSCASGTEVVSLGEQTAAYECPVLSINELLSDPVGDGVDYLEVVNTSADTLDAACYKVAHRNTKGEVADAKALSSEPFPLPPGAYLLLSADTARVALDYGFRSGELRLQIKSFPSMPNDAGFALLLDSDGQVVDELPYTKAFHHPLLSDREGYALEKLHPCLPSGLSDSWTSAADDAGRGTPGRPNSQFRPALSALLQSGTVNSDGMAGNGGTESGNGPFGTDVMAGNEGTETSAGAESSGIAAGTIGFWLDADTIRPQSRGPQSQLLVCYRLDETYVISIRVFDRSGRQRGAVCLNALGGTAGCFVWNGTASDGEALPCGRYLLRVEAFRAQGGRLRCSLPVRVLP